MFLNFYEKKDEVYWIYDLEPEEIVYFLLLLDLKLNLSIFLLLHRVTPIHFFVVWSALLI